MKKKLNEHPQSKIGNSNESVIVENSQIPSNVIAGDASVLHSASLTDRVQFVLSSARDYAAFISENHESLSQSQELTDKMIKLGNKVISQATELLPLCFDIDNVSRIAPDTIQVTEQAELLHMTLKQLLSLVQSLKGDDRPLWLRVIEQKPRDAEVDPSQDQFLTFFRKTQIHSFGSNDRAKSESINAPRSTEPIKLQRDGQQLPDNNVQDTSDVAQRLRPEKTSELNRTIKEAIPSPELIKLSADLHDSDWTLLFQAVQEIKARKKFTYSEFTIIRLQTGLNIELSDASKRVLREVSNIVEQPSDWLVILTRLKDIYDRNEERELEYAADVYGHSYFLKVRITAIFRLLKATSARLSNCRQLMIKSSERNLSEHALDSWVNNTKNRAQVYDLALNKTIARRAGRLLAMIRLNSAFPGRGAVLKNESELSFARDQILKARLETRRIYEPLVKSTRNVRLQNSSKLLLLILKTARQKESLSLGVAGAGNLQIMEPLIPVILKTWLAQANTEKDNQRSGLAKTQRARSEAFFRLFIVKSRVAKAIARQQYRMIHNAFHALESMQTLHRTAQNFYFRANYLKFVDTLRLTQKTEMMKAALQVKQLRGLLINWRLFYRAVHLIEERRSSLLLTNMLLLQEQNSTLVEARKYYEETKMSKALSILSPAISLVQDHEDRAKKHREALILARTKKLFRGLLRPSSKMVSISYQTQRDLIMTSYLEFVAISLDKQITLAINTRTATKNQELSRARQMEFIQQSIRHVLVQTEQLEERAQQELTDKRGRDLRALFDIFMTLRRFGDYAELSNERIRFEVLLQSFDNIASVEAYQRDLEDHVISFQNRIKKSSVSKLLRRLHNIAKLHTNTQKEDVLPGNLQSLLLLWREQAARASAPAADQSGDIFLTPSVQRTPRPTGNDFWQNLSQQRALLGRERRPYNSPDRSGSPTRAQATLTENQQQPANGNISNDVSIPFPRLAGTNQ